MKNKYEIIVLISSMAIMTLELTAPRVLSPYVGTSYVIYTSIIGIILISMSIGYYIGGILADKKPKTPLLSIVFLLTGLFIGLIPILEVTIINQISNTIENLKIASILTSTILFVIPSSLLAMVYPYCLKLKETTKENIGKTSGKLSFYSTIGSIIGTFLTGFCLLPLIGNKLILLLLSSILLIISFIITRNKKILILTLLSLLIITISFNYSKKIFKTNNPYVLLDKDTQYSRVYVSDIYYNNEKLGRELMVGKRRQSFNNNDLDNINYYNYFNLIKYLKPDFENVLLIGGGGYSYPISFSNNFKDKKMDIVEIDPEFIKIAKKYFNYQETENIINYVQDGRSYLNKNKKKYDIILLDAYKEVTAPYELTTIEAIKKMESSLTENGIIIANIMGTLEGEKSLFLQAEYQTMKEVFDEVIVMSKNKFSKYPKSNIFVCFKNYKEIDKNKSPLFNTIIDFEVNENIKILTDDYAPVEYYISKY